MSRISKGALALIALCSLIVVFLQLRQDSDRSHVRPSVDESGPSADAVLGAVDEPAVRDPVPDYSPSPAPGTSAANLIVLVRDATGPLGDAQVVATDSGRQLASVAVTDADGRARFEIPQGAYQVIGISSAGVSEAHPVRVPEAGVVEVEVLIPPQAMLTGRVVDADGTPVPEAKVIPLVLGVGLSWEGVIRAISTGQFDRLAVETDESGTFRMYLPAGTSAELLAGAPGLAMEAPVSVNAGQLDTVLTVGHLYAACARFEVPASASSWNWSVFEGGIVRSSPVLEMIPDPRSVALSGAPPELSRLRSWPDLNVFALCERPLGVEESVRLTGELPGFLPIHADIRFRPVTRDLERQVIPLVDRAPARGSLSVRFDGMAIPESLPAVGNGARGTLYLFGDAGTFDCPIFGIYSGTVELHGIPAGDYRAVFQVDSGQFDAQPSPVQVRAGEATPLTVRFPDLGSIEFDLRQADGDPAVSRAVLTLTGPLESEFPSEFDYYLPGPPYVVDLLTPGTYKLKYWISGGSAPGNLQFYSDSGFHRTLPLFHPK